MYSADFYYYCCYKPLTDQIPVNINYLWIMAGAGVVSALLFLFCYKREYEKTYANAVSQTEIWIKEKPA
ncbi:hypothetical protein [Snodgrassella alvi]|uniref:hypothetical protein n=1 Tax=Snodgrassella alvi TaxID=1196083 RepID=UPI0012FE5FA4|nr:hypothetical protein [Snodgrassella alvi]